jgi:hypothetical protein
MRILLAVFAATSILVPAPALQEEDVDKLIKDLASSDFEAQGRAAKLLEQIGTKALPALKKAAQGANPEIKRWAERIIGRIEAAAKAPDPLVEKLGSADDEEREAAEAEFRKLGRAALPRLAEAAKSSIKNLRRRAERLIKEIEALPAPPTPPAPTDPAAPGRVKERLRVLTLAGGGKETEAAILSALGWLARHQSPDGSWGAEEFTDRCAGAKCSGTGSTEFDRGVTGLALLAFLGAGYGPLAPDEAPGPAGDDQSRRFGEAVRKGLGWLISRQDRLGGVGARGSKFIYSHAVGALALCEAYFLTAGAPYKEPANKAVAFLLAARNPGKAWRYATQPGDNDSSVTLWCVAALHAATQAKLWEPTAEVQDGVKKWLDEVTDGNGRVGYNAKGSGKVYVPGRNEQFLHHETMTALSLLAPVYLPKPAPFPDRDPRIAAGLAFLAKDLPQRTKEGTDLYYWFWATLAMYPQDGPEGPEWKKWNAALQSALISSQEEGVCVNGSWKPEEDRWGFEAGRVYSTSLAALALETPFRVARPKK